MESFVVGLMLVVLLVEATVELETKFSEGPIFKPAVSLVLGGGLSWLLGVDLFSYVGISPVSTVPAVAVDIINAVVMGILVCRYAGEINALLEIFKSWKVNAQSRM